MSINEKVISKFIQIHGFVYNYSLVDIKENYCKSNGINLIIIPYTEILKIYTILDNFLK
jgi:hypothetical protein